MGTPAYNTCMKFNGSGNSRYIEIAHNDAFNLEEYGGNGFTVEAWVNPASTSGNQVIACKYSYNTQGSFEVDGWKLFLDGSTVNAEHQLHTAPLIIGANWYAS